MDRSVGGFKGKARIGGRKAERRGETKGCRRMELEVEQKGLKGTARFIQ